MAVLDLMKSCVAELKAANPAVSLGRGGGGGEGEKLVLWTNTHFSCFYIAGDG